MISPTVYYESFSDDAAIDPKCVITKNDDGSYSVRDMNDMVPFTMTTVCELEGDSEVNDLDSLYYCLPCLCPYETFSENDGYVITSVRWKGMCKGTPGGYFPSNVMVTVHLGDKPFSLRVSRKKLHVAGTRSVREAAKVSSFVLGMISDALSFHRECRKNSALFTEAIEWLSHYSRGNSVKRDVIVSNISVGNIEVSVHESFTDYYIWWPANSPDSYAGVFREIRARFVDATYASDLVPRASLILSSREPCTDVLNPLGIFVCMTNYSYWLDFHIDRLSLAKKLKMLGYDADFRNTSTTDIVVNVVDEKPYEDDFLVRRRNEKLFETVFKITQKGKITCSGCGKRQEAAYKRLMTDIISVCDKDVVM